MKPTYSTAEALCMMRDLQNDKEGLIGIWELVVEERKRYCLQDLGTMEFYYDILVEKYVKNELRGFFDAE